MADSNPFSPPEQEAREPVAPSPQVEARLSRRFLALYVDGIVMVLVTFAIAASAQLFLASDGTFLLPVELLMAARYFVPPAVVFCGEATPLAASPGKLLVGLVVRDMDGRPSSAVWRRLAIKLVLLTLPGVNVVTALSFALYPRGPWNGATGTAVWQREMSATRRRAGVFVACTLMVAHVALFLLLLAFDVARYAR